MILIGLKFLLKLYEAYNNCLLKRVFSIKVSFLLGFIIHSIIETQHEISNNVVCVTSKSPDQPTHMQSDQSLC